MFEVSTTEFDIPELKTDFVFRRQPVAIPGDLRPGWRIGLLVLLIHTCCRSARTSLTRLHVLSWGIRTEDSRRTIQAAIEGGLSPDSLVVRFEPFLNRAVDFAIGEGIIRRSGGNRIELTAKGKTLALELTQAETAYLVEKRFMNTIRQHVTETLVDGIFGGG
jgi:hypothetical protein